MSGEVDTDRLVAAGRALGLDAVGVAAATILEPARSVLQLRKEAGLASDMQFTYRNPQRSTNPETVLAGAASLVVAALRYPDQPQQDPQDQSGAVWGTVARYTWRDYYQTLRSKLESLAELLTESGHRCRVVADSNALVDRNAAWSAGIGWYGKNSNLLLPDAGSWFVLGAIATTAKLAPTGPPLADGCGRCTRCIDECPTGAIVAPGVVDAGACLAWIVQAAGPIPHRFREAVGDRIYGCDDCQTVCPPNRSNVLAVTPKETGPSEEVALSTVDVLHLLAADDAELEDRYGRWYIAERNLDYLRRTALVVLGNTARPDAAARALVLSTLKRYLDSDTTPLLQAHALWASRRLGCHHLANHLREVEAMAGEWEASVTQRFEAERWSVDAA